MTSVPAPATKITPWLSVWLRPRATIDAILADNPRRHVLLLALLATAANFAFRLLEAKWLSALTDWRIIAAIAVVIVVVGALLVNVNAFVFRLAGKLLGGSATASQLRPVIAWGFVPLIAALPVLAIAILMRVAGYGQAIPMSIGARVIAGALSVWSLVVTLFMLGRVQRFGFWRTIANALVGYAMIFLAALLFRVFLFQPFTIPSGSMKPTLVIGDYVFASKYAYGYTRFSLPFAPPLFSGRILGSQPQYGDLVVFRLPRDPSTEYVKRVVGLPGDRIQMIRGALHINGVAIKHERIDDLVETDSRGQESRGRRWRETLPNGVSYVVLDLQENSFYDNTNVYQVPAGHFFVLGDNLDNSQDSRALSQVGYIPFENLVGRMEMIYFSVDAETDPTAPKIRLERIGTIVR